MHCIMPVYISLLLYSCHYKALSFYRETSPAPLCLRLNQLYKNRDLEEGREYVTISFLAFNTNY